VRSSVPTPISPRNRDGRTPGTHRVTLGVVIASGPAENLPPPAAARRFVGGDTARLVWENELGGLTYELTGHDGRRFLKWGPADHAPRFRAEADRLAWAAAFTPVPRVLTVGGDGTHSWLLTAGLPGGNAVADRWHADPRPAVHAIGAGLRALHERLPLAGCPFSWSVDDRLALIRAGAALDPREWHAEHAHLGVAQALRCAADPPAIDRLVVCHGDACAPNTLLDDAGRFTGHVDLGTLGVADRWADLAVATWSATWNYGPGWEQELLAAYGVAPDPERTRYYRLLWDLGP